MASVSRGTGAFEALRGGPWISKCPLVVRMLKAAWPIHHTISELQPVRYYRPSTLDYFIVEPTGRGYEMLKAPNGMPHTDRLVRIRLRLGYSG